MPGIRFKPVKTICVERAKKDAIFHYQSYLDSLINLLNKNNSTKIRLEIIRLKKWINKYEIWASNWHNNNYIRCQDSYVDPEDAYPSERVDPPKAPFVELFSDIIE